jgi:hypothetical protein
MQVKVSALVDATMAVLDTYQQSGANFDGRAQDDWAVVPESRKALFAAELRVALQKELDDAAATATAQDIYDALEAKFKEKVRRDLLREKVEAEQAAKAAELLAGKSPEEKEAILKALGKT